MPTLPGRDEIAQALKSALVGDPGFTLLIRPTAAGQYKGIGIVMYTSQRVGVPVENLRLQMDDGEILSLDELRARHPAPPSQATDPS